MRRALTRRNRECGHLAAAMLSVVLLAFACTDKGTEPKAVSYRLYISNWTGSYDARVFVVDVATDSVLDSTETVGVGSLRARATADGKYLIRTPFGQCTDILTTQTLTRIADLPGCQIEAVLALRDRLIVGQTRFRIDYISYPELQLLGSDTVALEGGPRIYDPVVDQKRGLVYFSLYYGEGHVDSTGLLAWDYRQRRVRGVWNLRATAFTLRPGTDDVYAITSYDPAGAHLVRYDLANRSIAWQKRILTPNGSLQLTPDGRELWRTDRGFVLSGVMSGYIHIHDPATGSVLDSISLFGYLFNPELPMVGRGIAFTPDGTKAYVATSDFAYFASPVLVVDVSQRKIVKLLLNDGRHLPYYVDIAPAP